MVLLKKTNANWISLQPFGVVTTDSSGVEYDRDDIWECSSYKGLIKNINIAHDLGYKVFLKPHLILKFKKPGMWVGNMKFGSENNWQTFENSYLAYITSLAIIADSLNVEMFSLGTELGTFPRKREKLWVKMFDTVRSIYHNQITYCANFDEYYKFPFWNKVDVLGIDAYFTVDNSRRTSLDKCREGWKEYEQKLKELSIKWNKKILFAEFGYTSTNYCANKPFGGHGNGTVNLVAQANAYRAVFDTFWDEDWFVGGFSWFWKFDNNQPENYDNISYSPQNKPAENIIAKFFYKYR
jgi:hypothetical protein